MMDAFYAYTYGTAAWLSVQAIPLLLAPKIILALLGPDERHSTDLEVYLSRTVAINLLFLAIIVIGGTIPISSVPAATSSSSASPYAFPIVHITTLYHVVTAIYCYANYTSIVSAIGPNTSNTTGYILGGLGSGFLAIIGLWCVLFGTGGHVSKRTGADKRTAGWPFRNERAYNKKKDRKMG